MKSETSDLQQEILQRAMTGRDARLRRGPAAFEPNNADVDTGELLAQLRVQHSEKLEGDLLPNHVEPAAGGRRSECDNEQMSLARAIARLWRKGLVRVYRASPSEGPGIGLTEAGIEAARESGRRQAS